MGDGFYRSKDPNNSIKVLKKNLQKKITQRTKKTQNTHAYTQNGNTNTAYNYNTASPLVYNNMRWLGDSSHRGQGCQAWTAVGLPPRYPREARVTDGRTDGPGAHYTQYTVQMTDDIHFQAAVKQLEWMRRCDIMWQTVPHVWTDNQIRTVRDGRTPTLNDDRPDRRRRKMEHSHENWSKVIQGHGHSCLNWIRVQGYM